MRIAFLVNSIEGETANYTTTHLALSALSRGHDLCYLTPGDFVLRPDDSLVVRALMLPANNYKKAETLYKDLRSKETYVETLDVSQIDILLLRNDPSEDSVDRPWAAHVGAVFGRLAAARGGYRSQRPGWIGPGAEQALLPGLSGLGPARDAHRQKP